MNFDKIKDKIKLIFGGYSNYMETLDSDYKACEKELSSIFAKVSSSDKISTYTLNLYKLKIDILTVKVNNILDKAKGLPIEEKKNISLSTIGLLMFITLVFSCIAPEFLLMTFPFLLIIITSMRLRSENFAKSDYSHLKSENNPIYVLLNNCNTFLNKHLEKNKEVRNTPIKDLSDIELADNIIRQNLKDGYLSDHIDPKIEEIVVKLLQDELESEETDIRFLLCTARENIEEEKSVYNELKQKKLVQ